MTKNVLEVENLNVEFDGNRVIKDVSFSVNKREVLIILGPNGAGKTTLLRTLLGLVPYTGKIIWNSDDINYLPSQEFFKRRGSLPLTIDELFKLKDMSQKKTEDILDEVGLDPSILKREYGALSTGQYQRIMIAWAIVDEPSVLLFDEPTAGIDIGGQETIYSILHDIWKKRNMTILLVTHDLSVVWEHANNVLCLNKRKLCSGKPEKVLNPERLEELYGTGIKIYRHDHEKSK